MRICAEIEMLPVIHGKELFAREVRRLCSGQRFDCVAVDIPPAFQDDLSAAVDGLPLISALIAHEGHGVYGDDECRYYIPVDPCDAMIEGVRQARQRRIPFYCVGAPELENLEPLPPLPDEYSVKKLGADAYAALCGAVIGTAPEGCIEHGQSKHIAAKLRRLRSQYKNILAIIPLKLFKTVISFLDSEEISDADLGIDTGYGYTVQTRYINPDHLFFALGELPFITAKTQMERQDPFAEPVELLDAVKELFTETRDNYFDDKEQAVQLSPVRIQTALTYLRNLTVMSGELTPSLIDIVEAAKGVGGNAYALRILKNAHYYPFLPIESGDTLVNIGIKRMSLIDDVYPGAGREVYRAVNLFRDKMIYWRRIDLKPDPSVMQKKKYRYSWDPYGMCSHTPEDTRIERFNSHARGKAMRVVTEHLARTEKFSSSVKDGIDIRETLRNWHTGSIYVKELPPAVTKLDTVIIIFDESHDGRYQQRTTWYAEHEEESTLSFYATGTFEDLIGPGIARCTYGGVAMLFPPRNVPDIFRVAEEMGVTGCAEQLVTGSLVFSREKNVAYIAAKAPSVRLRAQAGRFKKHLVWIPLSTFSNETLSRLRRFHVLNGKNVRSWAAHFIGDEL
ncbi:MAG: hypothetical protein FWB85_09895 [Chitinispirillia bacterium]|nr:hypothetical protein [Chitinispirillia bacterium]MCL2242515.1 hypothetical protein [Chitinispirillia bacterium]